MPKITIKKMKADSNDPSVKAYEKAVMDGVAMLSDKQRQLLKQSLNENHLESGELKKLLKPKYPILAAIARRFRSAHNN